MKFSTFALTTILVSPASAAFRPAPSMTPPFLQRGTSLKVAVENMGPMGPLVEFDHSFKAGLKFILVPQYDLKEKAKAARLAKETIEKAGMDSFESLGLVPTSEVLESVSLEDMYESLGLPVPDLTGVITAATDATAVEPSLPEAVSKMSIPDTVLLRETLTNALPDKSPTEINQITRSLNEITNSVYDRAKDANDIVQSLSSSVPDVSDVLGDEYQEALINVAASDSSPVQVLSTLRERITSVEILQFRGSNMPEIIPAFPTDKFDAVFDNLQQLLHTSGWTITDLMKTLNTEELGGWYAGAIAGVFLVVALLAHNKTPAPERKLVRRNDPIFKIQNQDIQTPPPAVMMQGGGGAAMALPMQVDEEKLRLESLVSDLTMAVTALSRELKELKIDKARTDYALATMKSEVRTLRNAMDANEYSERKLEKEANETLRIENELQAQLLVAEEKVEALEMEKVSLKMELNALKSEAKSLPKTEILLNEEELKSKLQTAERKVQALEKEKASLTKQMNYLTSEAKALPKLKVKDQQVYQPTPPITPPPGEMPKNVWFANVVNALSYSAEANAAAERSAQKKAAVSTAVRTEQTASADTVVENEQKETVASTVVKSEQKETVTSTVVKSEQNELLVDTVVKSEPKRAAASNTVKAVKSNDDWSAMSIDDLKRKTVRELTSYLKSRGVKVVDDKGKLLRKADLYKYVQSVTA